MQSGITTENSNSWIVPNGLAEKWILGRRNDTKQTVKQGCMTSGKIKTSLESPHKKTVIQTIQVTLQKLLLWHYRQLSVGGHFNLWRVNDDCHIHFQFWKKGEMSVLEFQTHESILPCTLHRCQNQLPRLLHDMKAGTAIIQRCQNPIRHLENHISNSGLNLQLCYRKCNLYS